MVKGRTKPKPAVNRDAEKAASARALEMRKLQRRAAQWGKDFAALGDALAEILSDAEAIGCDFTEYRKSFAKSIRDTEKRLQG